MRKIAKINIPMEKLEACSDAWTTWINDKNPGGNWSATITDNLDLFIKNEKVFIIEGDSDVINPVITKIMEILKT
jgi:hypothetical protein